VADDEARGEGPPSQENGPVDVTAAAESETDNYWARQLGRQSTPSGQRNPSDTTPPAPRWPPSGQFAPPHVFPTRFDASRSSSEPKAGGKSRHQLVIGMLIVLLLLGVATGYFLTKPSGPTLTLQQARQAFKATWPGFNSGFAYAKAPKLAKFGTKEMDEAVVGWYNCGCGPWLANDKAVRLSVPVEHAYPLSFLAEVSTPDVVGGPTTQEAVLTKASAAEPWRVAYMVAFEGSRSYLGPSGVRSAPHIPVKTALPGSQLAAFFESMVDTGAPPANDSWPVDGSMKDEIDRQASVVLSIEQSGDSQIAIFQPVDHTTAFPYPGGDIVCGAIHETQRVMAPLGSPIVQPVDRSNYGPLLLPGSYPGLTKSGTHDYCVTITTAGLVTPISFFGGIYRITGQPG
jgi:hypothetical protein